MQKLFKFCKRCNADSERYADGRCKACTLSRNSSWYQQNKETRRKSSKDWDNQNPEKRKAIHARYWEKNKEKLNEKRRGNRVYNPIRERLKSAKRRALMKVGGVLSANIIETLLELQKGLCACCKAPLNGVFHLDHKIPLSRGGLNSDDNVQLLLPACNLKKYTKTPEEFIAKTLAIQNKA